MRFPAIFLALNLVATSAFAGPVPDKLDPKLMRALDTGLLGPGVRANPAKSRTVRALAQLRKTADASSMRSLEKLGGRIASANGRPLVWKNWVVVDVDRAAAKKIAALESVERLEFLPRTSSQALDVSAALIGLEAARGARPTLDRLTGAGILIADQDSSIDVFHPVFFRADAGYFDWIDVDENFYFAPGTDAIDLDRDGVADPNEIARPLMAQTVDYKTPLKKARDPNWDPALDWLYLDENGNQERDFGKEEGFDDSVPAFGEPLFVPDDVNQNGQLDRNERVVRLGSSKIRKVYINVDVVEPPVDHVFERGIDLSSMVPDFSELYWGEPDSFHGTMVNSVLIGDVPLVGRRWVGMAPDADLVVAFAPGESALIWLLDEKPDVFLHERLFWTGYPLDGSDPQSKIIDQSVIEDQRTHTCPTGNMAASRKHANVVLNTGTSQMLEFEVPAFSLWPSWVALSINVQHASTFGATLTEPDGDVVVLDNGSDYPSPQIQIDTTLEITSKGNRFLDSAIYSNASTHLLPSGVYKLELTATSSSGALVDAYLKDSESGWGLGAAWSESIAVAEGTITLPATAEHCISVGSFPGHLHTQDEPWFDGDEGAGEVRGYSGRGPRIDGLQKPDLLAPDNPWTALCHYPPEKIGLGLMFVGGGTSAATPHVAGVAALLAQAGIRGDAARVALRQSAISDATTGATPNSDYGYGRLNAAGALGVEPEGKPPTVWITPSAETVAVGANVELVPTAKDPEGSPLELEWDDGYDGTWDVPYGPPVSRSVSRSEVGRFPYKVRARDASGRIAEAVVWIAFEDSVPDAGVAPKPASDDEGGGCGCRIHSGAPNPAWLLMGLGALGLLRRSARRKT